jgi:hypothetical protein
MLQTGYHTRVDASMVIFERRDQGVYCGVNCITWDSIDYEIRLVMGGNNDFS